MRRAACLLLVLLLGAQAATPTGRRQLQGGSGVSAAISGGQTAPRNRYRWNASLRQGEGVLRGDPFCSAALIEMRVLVTAASCVLGANLGQPPLPANAFRFPQVRLDNFEYRGGEYEIRKVQALLAPTAWKRGSPADDIALLLLDRPSRMPPIALPKAGGPNPAAPLFQPLTVLGWGQWDAPPTQPDIPRYLQEVQLPLQRQAQCEYFYPQYPVWRNKKSICAGMHRGEGRRCCRLAPAGQPPRCPAAEPTGHGRGQTEQRGQNKARAGLCKGDYGGPLFRPGRNASTDLLVGISAFKGDPGCKGGKPSGFTNVASYIPWIQGGFNIFFKGANVTSQYRLLRDPGYDPSLP
ncbi:hypothetical protein ABPG77_006449 [Micractinium sp. CCAP 211/92]